MTVRTRYLLGVAAVLVAAGAITAGGGAASRLGAPAPTSTGAAQKAPAPPATAPNDVVLYDQNNSDSGVGIVSQNFEASLDSFDAQGADDFSVPSSVRGWKINSVSVTGVYFNGPGPATSENVTLYRDAGGVPGAVVNSQTVVGADSGGSFTIALSPGVALRPGRYWVSVQANMDFTPNGEWGWESRTVQGGRFGAAWQNPGDGFATGCTTWANMVSCIGPQGEGPDFMFSLSGLQG